MPFQSVPDSAEVVIRFVNNGQQLINVLGFNRAGGYDGGNLTDLAGAIDLWVGTTLINLVSVVTTYNSSTARGLANDPDLEVVVGTHTGAGGVGGSGLPLNAALCVTHRTGFMGRSFRGRSYLGGLSETYLLSPVEFTHAWADDVSAAWNQIPGYVGGYGWTYGVISRFHAKAKRATGVFTAIELSEVRNYMVDSMRGRLFAGH